MPRSPFVRKAVHALRSPWWAFVGLALVVLAVTNASNGRAERAEAYDVQNCNVSGNPLRAYLLLRGRIARDDQEPVTRLAPVLFALRDCEKTRSAGRPVLLNKAASEEYLRVLSGCRLPIVHGGRVVGSKPFPRYDGDDPSAPQLRCAS